MNTYRGEIEISNSKVHAKIDLTFSLKSSIFKLDEIKDYAYTQTPTVINIPKSVFMDSVKIYKEKVGWERIS